MTEIDSSYPLAEHLAAVRYEDLSDEVLVATTRSVVDTVGVMIAGSSTEPVRRVLEVAQGWGGAPQSSVWGSAVRLPEYLATWANASMVHQFDFDDTHDTAVCHPTSASLTAALAVAETQGGVDGRLLLTAVAVGNDLACRLALAIDGSLWDYAWVRAPVVGIFGAAAAAGVVLGLDADRMHQSLGLALPQAAGTLESVVGQGSMVRSLRDGLAYKDSVLAARLAEAGVRGEDRVFDGPYGLYASYFRGEYDRSVLLADLGTRFEGANVSIKPWPSCRHTHATITAVLQAVSGAGRRGSDVADLLVHVGKGNIRLCEKPWPTNHADALCNLPFAMGVALVHDAVPLDAFEPAGLVDPAVRSASERVRWQLDPRQDVHGTIEPGRVRVRFHDGTEVEEVVDRGLGHPTNPMDEAQERRKWDECLGHAAAPPATPDRLLAALRDLADVEDVRSLAEIAAPAARPELRG